MEENTNQTLVHSQITTQFSRNQKIKVTLLFATAFILGVLGIYFWGIAKKQTVETAPKSCNNLLPGEINPTKSPAVGKITDNSLLFNDLKSHILSYADTTCSATVQFPQVTHDKDREYLWFVDASNERTYVLSERSEIHPTPDHSIVIFAIPPLDVSPYYSSSIEIVCAPNEDNINIEAFIKKFTNQKDENGNIPEYKNLGKRTFGKASFVILNSERDNIYYLGIYKNNLIYISNSNKTTGALQQVAESIIDSISF